MMIFQFMEKYRVPILVSVLLAMAGFGVWAYLLDAFTTRVDEEIAKKQGEIVASFEVGGERIEITRAEYYGASSSSRATDEESIADRLAFLIRRQLGRASGIEISDNEIKAIVEKQFKEPIIQNNDGRYDPQIYVAEINQRYGLSPAAFEELLREDAAVATAMREVMRPVGMVPTAATFEAFKKNNQKIKIKGIVFDTEAFKEAAKLERDGEELSEAAKTKLDEYWTKLDDVAKRRYNVGGAQLTVEYVGFLFGKESLRDDAAFLAEFQRENPLSGKSLDQLTAEFVADDSLNAKLELRLDRHRALYGLAADADVKVAFPTRRDRLVAEWKILSLVKKIHGELQTKVAAGETVDFEEVAKANNLQSFTFKDIKQTKLSDHEDVGGPFVYQLQALAKDQLFQMRTFVSPDSVEFFDGVVDVPGKHASIWRLLDKDPNPIPSLRDVADKVATDFEAKEAERLRDEAMTAFEKRMNDFLDEKVAEFAATARAEADQAFSEETKDLDAEADKDRIAEIRAQKDEEAKNRIEGEKAKHKTEAFTFAIQEPGTGLVVEEGFFTPFAVRTETVLKVDDSTVEERARSFVRREFSGLHDQPGTDRFVDQGTVSDVVTSAAYRTMKGQAILVAKKEPTIEDFFLNPSLAQQAENFVRQKSNKPGAEQPNVFSFANLEKGDFKVEMPVLKAELDEVRSEARKRSEDEQRLADEHAARLKRLAEERKAAADAARKKSEDDAKKETPPDDTKGEVDK